MGKDLHYLVIKFFRDRMDAHSKVKSYSKIPHDNEILYKVERTGSLPPLIVHLSDSYRYTLHDYYAKPDLLGPGDFILIARPEAAFDPAIVNIAALDRIGIGKIGKLLGALHRKDVWRYVPRK